MYSHSLGVSTRTFTEKLHRSKELGNIQVAVLTDPWGTVIELTEGLARYAAP